MQYSLSEAELEPIVEFALEYYEKKEKKQTHRKGDIHFGDKRIIQAATGKIAEHAVHKLLNTTPPDYIIYQPGQSTTEPDLKWDDYNVHVKSCNPNRCDWLADPTTDPVVYNPAPNDVFVFCVTDDKTSTVTIKGVYLATDLIPFWVLPDSPVIAQKGKKAIHHHDIQHMALPI